jgi:hypothetical protein
MGHALTARSVVLARARPARATHAAGALVLVWSSLAACGAEPGPTPEAIARYAERSAAEAPAGPAEIPALIRVRITAIDAADIPDSDDGPGETDPYLVIEHEGQRFETTVAVGDAPAVWGDSVIFDSRPGAGLMVTLMDDDTGLDERLGVLSEPMPRISPGESQEIVLRYRDGAGGVVRLRVEGLAPP